MSTNEKKCKIRSNRVIWGHVTHFWNFGTPNISGTNEARKFKFGIEMDGSECQTATRYFILLLTIFLLWSRDDLDIERQLCGVSVMSGMTCWVNKNIWNRYSTGPDTWRRGWDSVWDCVWDTAWDSVEWFLGRQLQPGDRRRCHAKARSTRCYVTHQRSLQHFNVRTALR